VYREVVGNICFVKGPRADPVGVARLQQWIDNFHEILGERKESDEAIRIDEEVERS
jgi:hypothetical protein